MPTPLDISLVPKIVALITKVGISATYTEVTKAVYDPSAMNEFTGSYEATSEDFAVISTPTLNYENQEIDGDNILARDCYVFIKDYSTFTPKPSDVFTTSGKDWRIVMTTPYSTGDLTAAWKLQLRKN